MAYLIDKETKECCYLYAHHSFGRFQFTVDTLIEDLSVSKIHVIIEWLNGKWVIRDLSRNGTWLNHKRLTKEEHQLLHLGDTISFAGNTKKTYIVKDLTPPVDQLIKLSAEGKLTDQSIKLSYYHLIPENTPECAVVYQQDSGQWFIEDLDNQLTTKTPINDDSTVSISGEQWLFKSSHIGANTNISAVPLYYISDLNFIFKLSLDEETTELNVVHHDQKINLQTRSHHYLTLNLARYRARDEMRGLAAEDQGWVNTEQLVKDLGVDMRYLNIQIHRARKQFADVIEHVHDAENIIERQLRKVRFAGSAFTIYKGSQIESTLNVANSGTV